MSEYGPLVLIGGREWQDGLDIDAQLLRDRGVNEVVVIPTAAAFEHPERVINDATNWYKNFGANVVGLNVLNRRDAQDEANANIARCARYIYISDGSPLHLRSVLKDSLLWSAIVEAWHNGAVVAGSSAGATVVGDPMLDPRGGAFTLGLGLVRRFAVVPNWQTWTPEKARRMTHLVPNDTVLAEIEEQTALIRNSDGNWYCEGNGNVNLALSGQKIQPETLRDVVELG